MNTLSLFALCSLLLFGFLVAVLKSGKVLYFVNKRPCYTKNATVKQRKLFVLSIKWGITLLLPLSVILCLCDLFQSIPKENNSIFTSTAVVLVTAINIFLSITVGTILLNLKKFVKSMGTKADLEWLGWSFLRVAVYIHIPLNLKKFVKSMGTRAGLELIGWSFLMVAIYIHIPLFVLRNAATSPLTLSFTIGCAGAFVGVMIFAIIGALVRVGGKVLINSFNALKEWLITY